MRVVELALIATLLVLLYATLSTKTVSPKLSLKNDYILLREEAYSLARLIADSEILPHILFTTDESGTSIERSREEIESILRVLITALAPPNVEFKVIIRELDYATGTEVLKASTETEGFSMVTVAATALVVFTDSLHSRIYVIEVAVGRVV